MGERDRPSPRRSAIVLVRDGEGRVLLVRNRGGPFAGEWILPGGGLEGAESEEDAARRELREETGLEALSLHRVARYEVRVPARGFHGQVDLFRCDATGTARAGADGEACQWVEIDEARIHPTLARELRDAGVIEVTLDEVVARCDAAGIAMVRLG